MSIKMNQINLLTLSTRWCMMTFEWSWYSDIGEGREGTDVLMDCPRGHDSLEIVKTETHKLWVSGKKWVGVFDDAHDLGQDFYNLQKIIIIIILLVWNWVN